MLKFPYGVEGVEVHPTRSPNPHRTSGGRLGKIADHNSQSALRWSMHYLCVLRRFILHDFCKNMHIVWKTDLFYTNRG